VVGDNGLGQFGEEPGEVGVRLDAIGAGTFDRAAIDLPVVKE